MEPIKSLVQNGREIAQVARSANGLSPKVEQQANGHADADAFALANSQFTRDLEQIRTDGSEKRIYSIASAQAPRLRVEGYEHELINCCANNYLGFANHPHVKESAIRAIEQFGAGTASVRFLCGTQVSHVMLERRLAEMHWRPAAIAYASCFDANAGLYTALLGTTETSQPPNTVLLDESNHRSTQDGMALARAANVRIIRYRHLDLHDLEEKLRAVQDSNIRLISSDAVFGAEGSITNLPEMMKLADKYHALVLVDESHSLGVLGKNGRGIEEYYGMKGAVHIIQGTLGKAICGAAGGYTASSLPVVELLRQKHHPFNYSNSLPPPVVGAAHGGLDLLLGEKGPLFMANLHRNANTFRKQMIASGLKIMGDAKETSMPICPVLMGSSANMKRVTECLLREFGVYAVGIGAPTVPDEMARIRVQITAAHTTEDVQAIVVAFTQLSKRFGLI